MASSFEENMQAYFGTGKMNQGEKSVAAFEESKTLSNNQELVKSEPKSYTKKTYGPLTEQLFPKRLPLSLK